MKRVDPIMMLKSLMKAHNLKAKDMVNVLGVSKRLVSDSQLQGRTPSKDAIRKPAEHFNLPYALRLPPDAKSPDAGMMNTKKELQPA